MAGASRTKSKAPKRSAEIADANLYSTATAPNPATQRQLVEPNDSAPLGNTTEAELAEIAAADIGGDPELEAPESAIAVESLARVIEARMGHANWAGDPKKLAVFILSDRARELAGRLNATLEPTLDNGSRILAGRLWVSGPTFSSGYGVPLAADEPGAIFEEVTGKGVGNLPALVFDPSATDPEIRFYPLGLSQHSQVQRFTIAEKVFTLDGLDKVLTRFCDENIVTPDAEVQMFNPWANGDKYFPRESTESFFQGWLKSILSIAYRSPFIISFEQRGKEGRCDLLIFSRQGANGNSLFCHAAMELKVLRSFTSGGKTVGADARAKAIEKGLLQAIAYKKEQSAQNGLLCCYDMRKPEHHNGDGCFDSIKTKASRKGIHLRRYRLYGSSADLRADKYGAAS